MSSAKKDFRARYSNSHDASLDAVFSSEARPADRRSIKHKGFTITTLKLPILKAEPIELMTEGLGIAPPEMIFGDNFVSIDHKSSGFRIQFNAFDALDLVDKTGEAMLKVAHAREWQQTREKVHEGIKEVVKPFDWSYTTPYRGTTHDNEASSANSADSDTSIPTFQPTSDEIPLDLLREQVPIIFFDDVMLYEDELADNGIAMMSVKIRVMDKRLLLLCRFFLRLDNVLFRIRDTRVYVEFATGDIIREYVAREGPYEEVREKFAGRGQGDALVAMREPTLVVEVLPVVEKILERCKVGIDK